MIENGPELGVAVGVCLPSDCTVDNLDTVKPAIMKVYESMNVTGTVVFSDPEGESPTMTTGRVIGFLFFAAILLLMFLGFLTEYLPLFGGTGMNGEDKEGLEGED